MRPDMQRSDMGSAGRAPQAVSKTAAAPIERVKLLIQVGLSRLTNVTVLCSVRADVCSATASS